MPSPSSVRRTGREAPDASLKKVRLDAAFVRAKLEAVVKDEDLSRFIL